MFDFLNQNKNPIVKVFAFILLLTLITNLININYEVENYRLTRSISDLEEDNSILRAKYLSDTAMSKLDYKATALKMLEISNANSSKLSKTIEQGKFKELKQNYLDSHVASAGSGTVYLSGF